MSNDVSLKREHSEQDFDVGMSVCMSAGSE